MKGTNKQEGRQRVNITLKSKVRTMGEKLAKEDKRDLSHQLEWLIESEFSRRLGGPCSSPKAA
jgi:hypothetical protein